MNPSESLSKELRRRRYSEQTISTYVGCLARFLNSSFCKNKSLRKITKRDIRLYLERMSEKDLSGNTMNVNLMALKFYFEQIQGRKMWVDIKYSKVPERIQRVLSEEEIRKLLEQITNWKHRLMIELMYSSGMRVSEVVNIKIKDIELDKNYGFVRNGKGGKDRLLVLSKIVREKIKNLIEMEKLDREGYLFISDRKKKYNIRSLQVIVKKAAKKS